jgi:hypothetical protein
MNTKEKEILSLFLPEGIFEWFEVVDGSKTDREVLITLEEKNIPPITEKERGKRIISKGLKEIWVNDYPVRGRKTSLLFRRRYWQVEGVDNLLKREIQLCAEGTQLERGFAAFLKEQS